MKKTTQHVVRHPEGWALKRGGSSRATKVFPTQGAAIEYGRDVSRNQGAEFFIHGRNGQIRERNSYGNDPYPPRG
ncbi:MAG: DUF2188 domain-containing protein [Chitinophagales bacterium]|nr:DUF2188 domain-containing protein [Chitinophagales bacterium]